MNNTNNSLPFVTFTPQQTGEIIKAINGVIDEHGQAGRSMAAEFFDTLARRVTTRNTSLLGYAAKFNLHHIVSLLLATPGIYSAESTMHGPWHALCIAARCGHIDVFDEIIAYGEKNGNESDQLAVKNLFGYNNRANDVLQKAVWSQSLAMVERVLQVDGNQINAVAPYKQQIFSASVSALCEAVVQPNGAIVTLLLENGATVHNKAVHVHDSALCRARNNPAHIALLAAHGADLWGADAKAAMQDYVFANCDESIAMLNSLKNRQIAKLAFVIACGLAQLDLPVLTTLLIVDNLLTGEMEGCLIMHQKWKVIQMCKDAAKNLRNS